MCESTLSVRACECVGGFFSAVALCFATTASVVVEAAAAAAAAAVRKTGAVWKISPSEK